MNFMKKRPQNVGIDAGASARKTLKMETVSVFQTAPGSSAPTNIVAMNTELPSPQRHDWVPGDQGKFPCLSPIGSDSEEESGYVSCASTDQKSRETQDIDKLFADISDITNSPAKSDSMNDLSSGEQSDFCDLNKSLPLISDRSLDVEEEDEEGEEEDCNTQNGAYNACDKGKKQSDNLKGSASCQYDIDSHASETNLDILCHVQDKDSSSEEEGDADEVEEDEEQEEDQSGEDQNENEQESEEEEEEEEAEEVEEEVEDEENESDNDDDTTLEHESLPKVTFLREQSRETTTSDGTWVSDDENQARNDRRSSCSDGPELQDFFDGLGDGISYVCQDDPDDGVMTYPNSEYFLRDTSVQQESSARSDSDDDLDYIFKSTLTTGKCYAFPRRDPRTITEAVEFWETDFEVNGAIYPKMSVWETKGLAPTHGEDAEDNATFIMYKSLYDKWIKCNKNKDQWLQKYWGKSIETIAKMKGPAKRKLPLSSLNCVNAMETEDTSETPCADSADQKLIAERRRRRRHNALFSSSGCY